jgi:hypothetical protein
VCVPLPCIAQPGRTHVLYRWHAAFRQHDVVAMTPQILLNLLCHGIIKVAGGGPQQRDGGGTMSQQASRGGTTPALCAHPGAADEPGAAAGL